MPIQIFATFYKKLKSNKHDNIPRKPNRNKRFRLGNITQFSSTGSQFHAIFHKRELNVDIPSSHPHPLPIDNPSNPQSHDPPIETTAKLEQPYLPKLLTDDEEDDKMDGMTRFMELSNDNIAEFFFNEYDMIPQDNESMLKDEASVLSSTFRSSIASLENALFSHISTDTRSEITAFSDVPKMDDNYDQTKSRNRHISILSKGSSNPLFDRQTHVTNKANNNMAQVDTTHAAKSTHLQQWEKHFYELYRQASSTQSNPGLVLNSYLQIVTESESIYSLLTTEAQQLVSFAQFRAGERLIQSNHHSNVNEGIKYLQEASINGNKYAQYRLGVYEEQHGDLFLAADLFYKSSLTGYAPAIISLAKYLLLGRHKEFLSNGYEAIRQNSIAMLKEISNEGNSTASIILVMYYNILSQLDDAIHYSKRIVIDPSSPMWSLTNYVLSIIHLKGGKQYHEEAFQYMHKAAESTLGTIEAEIKSVKALRKLGGFYMRGIGTSPDVKKAFECIYRAAKKGDEGASVILAEFYLQGTGCQPSREAALNVLDACSRNISVILSRGLLIEPINPEEAMKEYNEVMNYQVTTADEYDWDIESIKHKAALQIARLTYDGLGSTGQNKEMAFVKLKELAELYDRSDASYYLGLIYLEGIRHHDNQFLVPQDKDNAFQCFMKETTTREASRFYKMGEMLQNGYITDRLNEKNAFDFFHIGASMNHTASQTQLGVYYFYGKSPVEKNMDLALQFFRLAATKNDHTAYLYLADYLVKDQDGSQDLNKDRILEEVCLIATSDQYDLKEQVSAYRLLALLINSGINPKNIFKFNRHPDLVTMYEDAKDQSSDIRDIPFRFTLICLWKAIKLNDHQAGKYLCGFCLRMKEEDRVYTVYLLEKYGSHQSGKMSLELARFLYTSNEKHHALQKYLYIAVRNNLNSPIGWESRIQAAKLVINDGIGKASNKHQIFLWLNEMIQSNDFNVLFIAYALLAKCHELNLCQNCDEQQATQFYEQSLLFKTNDEVLELTVRIKLLEVYYYTFRDEDMRTMITSCFKLLSKLKTSSEIDTLKAKLYYYHGILLFHCSRDKVTIRQSVVELLQASALLGYILAEQELGYIFGTTKYKENEANDCFENVQSSKKSLISLKGKMVESGVLTRRCHHKSKGDYDKDIERMKLAAALTYTEYHMDRQAQDWLMEAPSKPFSQILMLYYRMKKPPEMTKTNFDALSTLISHCETDEELDLNGRKVLSYGYFILGQCAEGGLGTVKSDQLARTYYDKAYSLFSNFEILLKVANIIRRNQESLDSCLLINLANAAKNNLEVSFEIAQYYEQQIPLTEGDKKNAQDHYKKASQSGHAEACYQYAMYCLRHKDKDHLTTSKRSFPNEYLEKAASKNHGPAYFELGLRKMERGMYAEGIDDLVEADFLNCHEASYRLGEIYFDGLTVYVGESLHYKLSVSYTTSYSYYEHAVENGNVMAMVKLGHFYEHGISVPQSISTARYWYMRAYKARTCSPGTVEYALGCLEETALELAKPADCDHHMSTAFDWFRKAYEAHHEAAKYKVGVYLLDQRVKPGRQEQGLQLLIEASDNSDINAMHRLATYYKEINEVDKAFDSLMRAETLCDPDALECIAECYEKGLLGKEIDMVKSAEHRMRAVDYRNRMNEVHCSSVGFISALSDNLRY